MYNYKWFSLIVSLYILFVTVILLSKMCSYINTTCYNSNLAQKLKAMKPLLNILLGFIFSTTIKAHCYHTLEHYAEIKKMNCK